MSWKQSLAQVKAGGKASPAPIQEADEEYDDYHEDEGGDYGYDQDQEDYGEEGHSAWGGEAAGSWDQVDESKLNEDAEELWESVYRSVVGGDKGTLLEKLLKQSAVTDKEILDPLGLGALDLDTKAIVPVGSVKKKAKAARARRRRKGARGTADAGEGDAGAALGLSGLPAGAPLPPEVTALLPTHEAFSPEQYLGTFHQDTKESTLRKGVKCLSQELSERTGQLKQLIRENFDRFTSCQSTIDDIQAKLRQTEGMGFGPPPPPRPPVNTTGGPKKGPSGREGGGAGASSLGGPEGIQRSLEAAMESSKATWGDVLDRARKVERIRSVTNLLNRFNNLFGMPGRIKALAAEGSWSQIVAEYQRANALIRPTANSARVWVTLYQEIEKRVLDVYRVSKASLTDPCVDPSHAVELIVFLAQLSHERLPGTKDEDSVRLFLDTVQQHLDKGMMECDATLLRTLARLRTQMNRNPTVKAAAMQFAGAWKLQGPSAWQLEPLTRADGDESSGPLDSVDSDPQYNTHSKTRHTARAARRRRTQRRTQHHTDSETDHSLGENDNKSDQDHDSVEHSGESDSDNTQGEGDDSSDGQGDDTHSEGGSHTHSDDDAHSSDGPAAYRGGTARTKTATRTRGGAGKGGGGGGNRSKSNTGVGGVGGTNKGESDSATAAQQVLLASQGPPSPPATLEELALLMWPGTSDWRPELDLAPAMRADLQWRLAPGTPRSYLLPEPSFRLAPAQSAWAEYVADLSAVLVRRMPGLWAVVHSPKFAQVPPSDVPSAVHESMTRVASLAKRLVDGIMQRYTERVQTALQTLAQAGPLCPAVELVVKELCRSWHQLRQSGTPPKAADGLRAAALSALSLYGTCLHTHMGAVPNMLFDNETWSLDVTVKDQPVTLLPSQLRSEVCVVMFHFGVLATRVRTVDEQGSRSAWGLLRDGLVACLAAYTACVTAYVRSLKPRLRRAWDTQGGGGGRGGDRGRSGSPTHAHSPVYNKSVSVRARPTTSPTSQHTSPTDNTPLLGPIHEDTSLAGGMGGDNTWSQTEQAAAALSLVPMESTMLQPLRLSVDGTNTNNTNNIETGPTTTTVTATGVTESVSVRGDSNTAPLASPSGRVAAAAAAGGSAFAAAAAQGASPTPRLADSAAAARYLPLSRADEARVLLVASNTMWVQGQVAPDVAQRYHDVLAGVDEEGEGVYESLLHTRYNEMGRAARSLLTVFTEEKRAQAAEHVRAYMSLISGVYQQASDGSPDISDQTSGSAQQMAVPTDISDAAHALVTSLVDTYTLVVKYGPPRVVGQVIQGLVEVMTQELRTQCEALLSCRALCPMLQLHLDLAFLTRVWQDVASDAALQSLEATQQELCTVLPQVVREQASQQEPSAALVQILARAARGRSGYTAFLRELSAWTEPLVASCLLRSQSSQACLAGIV